MIQDLSSKIVDYLDKEVILKENKEIYLYGARLLISTFIGTAVLMTIGVLGNRLIEAIIYEVVLSTSRQIMGGYHSKSYLGCILIYNIIFIFDVLILDFIEIGLFTLITIEILGFFITYYNCPIDHVNKVISIKKKNIFKKHSILFISVYIVLINIFYFKNNNYTSLLIVIFINIQFLTIGGRLDYYKD